MHQVCRLSKLIAIGNLTACFMQLDTVSPPLVAYALLVWSRSQITALGGWSEIIAIATATMAAVVNYLLWHARYVISTPQSPDNHVNENVVY